MVVRSRQRDLPFDADLFTVEWIMERLESGEPCPCCEKPFIVSPADRTPGQKHDQSPSVDRIRPELGYVVDNVAIICWRCNNLKRDATAGELQMVVDWIRSVT